MTDTAPDDALTMSWIVARALEGTVEPLILSGLCDRLNTTGMALTRAVIAGDLLDPQLGARGVRWERSGGRSSRPSSGAHPTSPRTTGPAARSTRWSPRASG